MSDHQVIYHKIKQLIRKSSKSNFETYTKQNETKLELVVDFDSLIFDHWIMGLLVKSKVINITFQIHFLSHIARKLAASGLGLSEKELSPETCHQFMQEYCNRTIGTTKANLGESCLKPSDFNLSSAVPEKKASFDEVDLRKEMKEESISDSWSLRFGRDQIICASRIEVFSFQELKTLEPLDLSVLSINKTGSIEFL